MEKFRLILILVSFILLCQSIQAQTDGQWGVCEFATLTDLDAFDPSGSNWQCKRAYVQASDAHYNWDGSEWVKEEIISPKIFYPPALAIDVSSTGTNRTIDLHQEYIDRYGTPAIKSAGAPTAVSTYSEDELYYYVTDYDTSVFANISISASGVMTYDVIATPTDNCSVLNVIFVVK